MSASVASDLDAQRAPRRVAAEKIAIFAVKLLVTGACFWYVSGQIDFARVLSAAPLLDLRWAAFAILVFLLQIPLVALRWRNVLAELVTLDERMTRAAMIAVTTIGVFFTQVLPGVMGEGVRAWLLVRLGCDWRNALTSVVIDRGIGVGLLLALGFVILLLPSGLTALGGHRQLVLVVYGGLLLTGVLALALAPTIVPLLARWRYSRWLASLSADAHRVLLGPRSPLILGTGCFIHALTILVIWSLGRAQGLALPAADAAILFTVMMGVALVPISIGGWGLRELADHGIAPERALLFSVQFGLTLAIASLPGALAWILYPVSPLRSAQRGMPR